MVDMAKIPHIWVLGPLGYIEPIQKSAHNLSTHLLGALVLRGGVICTRPGGFAMKGDGSFQKSGAPIQTPSSSALVIRTPTKRTPRIEETPQNHWNPKGKCACRRGHGS